MKKQLVLNVMGVSLISLGMAGSADAALVGRLLAGTEYQAYYDTDANLTWLADANAAGTTMNWVAANDWAANLDVAGVAGWRLPTTMQPDALCSVQSGGNGFGTGCTGSEMGNLFYNVLGGVANTSIAITHNANYDLFSNVQSNNYWSGTEFAPDTVNAWFFDFNHGDQSALSKNRNLFAWAVQSGDVSAVPGTVPVPAAVWLFGSGLLGLVSVARRKSANPASL